MKPSELAIKLEELRSRFEEEWNPEDVKSIAEFIIEYGGSFAVALRHHAALVACLKGHVCEPEVDDQEIDASGYCLMCGTMGCGESMQLLATIEREAKS